MLAYTEKIREAARRLLAEKRVDAVIGYRKGTIPFVNEPYVAQGGDQVDRFHWDGFCGVNLANYLPKRTDRVAIVAKGCDSRNIVVQILENQVNRDNLVVLGAPCTGMLDRRAIRKALNGREATSCEDKGGKVAVSRRSCSRFQRALVISGGASKTMCSCSGRWAIILPFTSVMYRLTVISPQ